MALRLRLGGVDQVAHLRSGSLSITDTNGAREGRCDFVLTNYRPVPTQTLVIDDPALSRTYFSGTVYGVDTNEYTIGNFFSSVSGHDTGAAPAASDAPFMLSDLSAVDTYTRLIAAYTPMSLWRLGEPSGTSAVDARGAVNGTYQGSPTLGVTGAMPTDPNTAVTFNGSSQWVDVGNARLAGGDFGISAWAKTTYSGTVQPIYCERPATGNALVRLEINTDGRPRLVYRDTAGTLNYVTPSSGAWNDGAWHHFAVTKAGTAVAMYVDGQNVRSDTLTATDTLTGTILAKIGVDPVVPAYFHGSLDEVAIFGTGNVPGEFQAFFHVATVYQYESATRSRTYDGSVLSDSVTLTTLRWGLAPGQRLAVSSTNLGLVVWGFTIQETTVTWLNKSTPRITVKVGSAPIVLSAAFP